MTPTKQEKQELAEFVAKVMGYVKNGGVWCHKLPSGWLEPLESKDGIVPVVFHDSQFLPLVLEMEARGWEIFMDKEWILLICKLKDDITESYYIKDNGHMIALCLAVREAIGEV